MSFSKLIKIPSQKEKLLKDIDAPNEKRLVKYKAHPEDLPVVLHSMDWTKEENPPLFVSLAITDLVLHNCMYDYEDSSNIMTKKIMERLGLKFTRLKLMG